VVGTGSNLPETSSLLADGVMNVFSSDRMVVCVLSNAGIGGPDWYREKEKSVRNNLSGVLACVHLLPLRIESHL